MTAEHIQPEDVQYMIKLKRHERRGKRRNRFYLKYMKQHEPLDSIQRLEEAGFIIVQKINRDVTRLIITKLGREYIESYQNFMVL
jgi:hypothetical protein